MTELQFHVIRCLKNGELPGWELRQAMEHDPRSIPAFHMLMKRCADLGFIRRRFVPFTSLDGFKLRERWYKATAKGVREYQAFRERIGVKA